MNTNVHIEKYDGIIEVKLDKPKVNAIDTFMSKEIADAFKELNENDDLRVGIITAEGSKIFSAGWDLKADVDYRYIERIYTFTNFQSAFDFAALVTKIAETNGHHPRLIIEFGRASISWWSHKIKGLHKNDFICASKTDSLFKNLQKS